MRRPSLRCSRVDDRIAFRAIIFVLVPGVPWRLLPREIGCSGVTARRRLRDWQAARALSQTGATRSFGLVGAWPLRPSWRRDVRRLLCRGTARGPGMDEMRSTRPISIVALILALIALVAAVSAWLSPRSTDDEVPTGER